MSEIETGVEDEIEMTPEMIEAGVHALLEFSIDYESREDGVRRIYEWMEMARRGLRWPFDEAASEEEALRKATCRRLYIARALGASLDQNLTSKMATAGGAEAA